MASIPVPTNSVPPCGDVAPEVELVRQQHGNGIKKRIIICCDGTWEDSLTECDKQLFSNVTRISYAIHETDLRGDVPIPQVVFYQPGIGTAKNWYSKYVSGVLGSTLGMKIQEAYGFIALNYAPGDEIFLFGFSRGAYTVRMIALLIGAIGILDRTGMDSFAQIFVAYQLLQNSSNEKEKEKQKEIIAPWIDPESTGHRRARMAGGDSAFSIRFIGVCETVGSLGIPDELKMFEDLNKIRKNSERAMFGFPDRFLGEHVEMACHALGVDETRYDFMPCLFEQTEAGKKKGQILRQCWFSGEHGDIGGVTVPHDLGDLVLFWLMSNVKDKISVNESYLRKVPDARVPWGEEKPSSVTTGFYIFTRRSFKSRLMPTVTDDITDQMVHSSILCQKTIREDLNYNLDANPGLIAPLFPFEEKMKEDWTYSEIPDTKVSSTVLKATGLAEIKSADVKAGSEVQFRRNMAEVDVGS